MLKLPSRKLGIVRKVPVVTGNIVAYAARQSLKKSPKKKNRDPFSSCGKVSL